MKRILPIIFVYGLGITLIFLAAFIPFFTDFQTSFSEGRHTLLLKLRRLFGGHVQQGLITKILFDSLLIGDDLSHCQFNSLRSQGAV